MLVVSEGPFHELIKKTYANKQEDFFLWSVTTVTEPDIVSEPS